MVLNKSLDVFINIIIAYLDEAQTSFGIVFNTRARRLTQRKLMNRLLSEGVGFLTKTLPRLSKHFDQVLAGSVVWNCSSVGFETYADCKFPKLFGELFQTIFSKDGDLLPDPDANSVKFIREFLNLFYKYELPYDESLEQKVISDFKQAEVDLSKQEEFFRNLPDRSSFDGVKLPGWSKQEGQRPPCETPESVSAITRGAQIALSKLFAHFDPYDIVPRHGPGAVATKQKPWDKFHWTNICHRITDTYPLDAYFYASLGAVCDSYDRFSAITNQDLPARVILVPKDSRGPRLISCEPVDFQWIQQGLRSSIYRLVESHPITKWNVFFTDQGPNRRGAYLGSKKGTYATLDLKEASDRVHLGLVRALFPENIVRCLEATRSVSTVLPSGEELKLQKFAPMGSALCFPVLALTIWSLLHSGAPDADTQSRILVYGDDVIVPTAYAESAMKILETFGLVINRSKSCLRGFFRESCGLDSFKGVDVTPVRLRTVWAESRCPHVYSSWISYANSFYDRRRYHVYRTICRMLERVYGYIPGEDIPVTGCPRLRWSSATERDFKKRWNRHLQKWEYRVLTIKSPSVQVEIPGWQKLLRYFTEAKANQTESPYPQTSVIGRSCRSVDGLNDPIKDSNAPFSVSSYTIRGTSILVPRWR